MIIPYSGLLNGAQEKICEKFAHKKGNMQKREKYGKCYIFALKKPGRFVHTCPSLSETLTINDHVLSNNEDNEIIRKIVCTEIIYDTKIKKRNLKNKK